MSNMLSTFYNPVDPQNITARKKKREKEATNRAFLFFSLFQKGKTFLRDITHSFSVFIRSLFLLISSIFAI